MFSIFENRPTGIDENYLYHNSSEEERWMFCLQVYFLIIPKYSLVIVGEARTEILHAGLKALRLALKAPNLSLKALKLALKALKLSLKAFRLALKAFRLTPGLKLSRNGFHKILYFLSLSILRLADLVSIYNIEDNPHQTASLSPLISCCGFLDDSWTRKHWGRDTDKHSYQKAVACNKLKHYRLSFQSDSCRLPQPSSLYYNLKMVFKEDSDPTWRSVVNPQGHVSWKVRSLVVENYTFDLYRVWILAGYCTRPRKRPPRQKLALTRTTSPSSQGTFLHFRKIGPRVLTKIICVITVGKRT